MSDVQVKFIVGTFADENGAGEAIETLKAARKSKKVDLVGAVLIRKEASGKVEYQEVGMTPAKGALGGVVLGAAVGILTGGLGLALGTLGGLVGGLVGRRRSGSKHTNDQIYHLLTALPPGSSAVLVVCEPADAPAVEAELSSMQAEVITADIPAELAAKLQAHGSES